MTAALEGGERSAARPRERPGTHFTGGWVGPRVGLDGRKISSPRRFDPGPSSAYLGRYTDWATGPTLWNVEHRIYQGVCYFQYVIRFHVESCCLNTISVTSIRGARPSLHRFLRNASVHNSINWKPFRPDFHQTHQSTDINSFTTVSKKQTLIESVFMRSLWIMLPHVYWTVHHLDSWIKRDQLYVTCFISLFNAQHVSDVNTSILRSLRLICWVISWVVLLWFDACWCYVVGWCGIRIPHHPSQTTT